MATKHDPHGHGEHHKHVSFETQDLGARGILTFFAILFLAAVIIHFAIWGLYRGFSAQAARGDLPGHPLAPQEPTPKAEILQNTPAVNINKFPQVRLQADDVADMQKMHQQERLLLDAQPWQDEEGKVHIPIARAMEVLAQRGLPARNGAQAQEDAKRQAAVTPTETGPVTK